MFDTQKFTVSIDRIGSVKIGSLIDINLFATGRWEIIYVHLFIALHVWSVVLRDVLEPCSSVPVVVYIVNLVNLDYHAMTEVYMGNSRVR